MGGIAVRVEQLGKHYTLGGSARSYGSLRESLTELITRRTSSHAAGARTSEGTEADRSLWALRDVTFEIQKGEVVGIVGRNGAGKSTLLKILSRVTEPTTGQVDLYGRLGALLEVGTGFHPELTGRENIYLNGAILGMARTDIRRHFDAIVAFAEVEKFVDTPVKRYSSGMYLRLAFAVAAHLEPEILVIDEVLAVGDAQFQKKCIGKMGEVASEGRTVIFVSHNLQVVRALCSSAILLDRGRVVDMGTTEHIVHRYNHMARTPANIVAMGTRDRRNRTSGAVRFTSVMAVDDREVERWEWAPGDTLRLRIAYEVFEDVPSLGLYVALRSNITNDVVTSVKHVLSVRPLRQGETHAAILEFPTITLRPGEYAPYVCLGDETCARFFDVVDENINLPWIQVLSDERDPHRTAGYFSIASRLTSVPV